MLSQKVDRLKKQTNIGDVDIGDNPDKIGDAGTFVRVILWRPIRLALTEPIIIAVTLLDTISWGLIYLFTAALSIVYAPYGWSETTISLAFFAIGIGVLLSIPVRFWDLRKISRKEAHKTAPEDKIGGFILAVPALAIGLWLFAWTVPPLVHAPWPISMIGLILIGFAANEIAYTLVGYLTDSYTTYASSANAGLSFFRGIISGVMPLFAKQMYSGLGANVAGSILAALATIFCVTPYVFVSFGERIRQRSQFARYSAEVNEKHGNE